MSKRTLVLSAIGIIVVVVLGIYFFLVNKDPFLGMKVETLEKPAEPQEGVQVKQVKTGDSITMHYQMWLEDGTKVYSSLDQGVPIDFKVGQISAIKGFNAGFLGMKVGEKRRITIPPDLAFGKEGFPSANVPADATLVVEVTLLTIN